MNRTDTRENDKMTSTFKHCQSFVGARNMRYKCNDAPLFLDSFVQQPCLPITISFLNHKWIRKG